MLKFLFSMYQRQKSIPVPFRYGLLFVTKCAKFVFAFAILFHFLFCRPKSCFPLSSCSFCFSLLVLYILFYLSFSISLPLFHEFFLSLSLYSFLDCLPLFLFSQSLSLFFFLFSFTFILFSCVSFPTSYCPFPPFFFSLPHSLFNLLFL